MGKQIRFKQNCMKMARNSNFFKLKFIKIIAHNYNVINFIQPVKHTEKIDEKFIILLFGE